MDKYFYCKILDSLTFPFNRVRLCVCVRVYTPTCYAATADVQQITSDCTEAQRVKERESVRENMVWSGGGLMLDRYYK